MVYCCTVSRFLLHLVAVTLLKLKFKVRNITVDESKSDQIFITKNVWRILHVGAWI